jgi:hypothetical protein
MTAAVSFVSAGGILSPLAYPQDYDVIVVGGVKSPGVCFLSGFKRVQAFDKKLGKGAVGSTITMTNKIPVEGRVKFLLGDDGVRSGSGIDQFALMGSFLQQLKYDPTKTVVTAISVYHPSLAALDVSSMVCEEIGGLEIEGQPGAGLHSLTIKLTEYLPPPPVAAVSTIKTTKVTPPNTVPFGPPTPTVHDGLQDQVGQLMAKAGLSP